MERDPIVIADSIQGEDGARAVGVMNWNRSGHDHRVS